MDFVKRQSGTVININKKALREAKQKAKVVRQQREKEKKIMKDISEINKKLDYIIEIITKEI